MRNILIVLFCFLSLISFSQKLDKINPETEKILKERSLVYFKTTIKSKLEINKLTKLISIEKVIDKTIYGYANRQELEALLNAGYSYTLIPGQGVNQNPLMKDLVDLSQTQVWNFYPTYEAYENIMAQFEANYPGLCKIDTIGVLPSGRRLLVAKISDNINIRENEPQFLYTSSIHGNEITGYVMMLHLIDYLLSNYNVIPDVTNLVNNIEIWINPCANPDGTYHGGNSTVSGAIRYNSNGYDLNRNYPDPQDGPHPDGHPWQPETMAFMQLADSNNFTMSANFHAGAELINYPWDTWAQLAADDTWWQYVSHEYADTAHAYAPSTYMDGFDNGISNGYQWYEIDGGRQDYMNYFHYCRESTIELSNSGVPSASTLLDYWEYNYRSLMNYMEQCLYGVRGIVTDSLTGQALKAKVFISGHDTDSSHVYSALPLGDYHRLLAAGTYTITFSAPGYISKSVSGVTASNYTTQVLNVQLLPDLTGGVLNGIVSYNNTLNSPLENVAIRLKQNGTLMDSAVTNTNGSFLFYNIMQGNYDVEVSTGNVPGGYNSTDALNTLRHFVGLTTLSGLCRDAADVDNSGFVNSIDALMIQKRFVQMISSFPAGDWLFNFPQNVNVTNQPQLIEVKGICTGDVNASYVP